MTFNQIWKKLRKHNQADYRQFCFCTGFAVMLISSYIMVLFSPIVQNTLPIGGDSRKQIYMIFVLAIVGCTIFSVYATGLFLRFKSKEIGVFMALGAGKNKVRSALLTEIVRISAGSMVLGIMAGCVMSWVTGNVIKIIAGKATEYSFAFTAVGFGASILYGVVVFLVIMVLAIRFMKRSNIIDIINEQRKQEPFKKTVTKWYMIIGIVLLVSGILIAFVVPGIVANLTGHYMGGWTNLFYILGAIGLYRLMVYSIACHRKGKNPQKYYKNLISYGMLKFTGSSIVRNMLVITLLIMASLFAMSYTPMNSVTINAIRERYEAKYAYRYLEDADGITKEDAEKMALEYGVEIKNYREAEFAAVLGSGIESENVDENGDLIKIYRDKIGIYECIGASAYRSLTGQDIQVENGNYYMIQSSDRKENIFNRFDDMDKLYFQDEEAYLEMKYVGNVEYQALTIDNGFDSNARYVISDQDYEALREGIVPSKIVKQVLFDTVQNEQAVDFANKLYQEFALRQSDNMKVCAGYDAFKARQEGDSYGYRFPAIFDPDNSVRETDWKYEPALVILQMANQLLTTSVYNLLFIYVAVICMAAVGIISYTRSQSVGVTNRQVFLDVEKLGADHEYLGKLLKEQVQKVFVLPTLVGGIGMFLFLVLVLWANDGRFMADESVILIFELFITAGIMLFQFIMYRISKKKVGKFLGL